jgi:hypothetical protein
MTTEEQDVEALDAEPIGGVSITDLRRRVAVGSVVVGLGLMLTGLVCYLVSFGSRPEEALILRTVACISEVLGAVIAYRAQLGFEYMRGDDASNLIIKIVRLAPYFMYAETYYIAFVANVICFFTYFGCGTFCSSALWFCHFQIVWTVVMFAAVVRFCLTH